MNNEKLNNLKKFLLKQDKNVLVDFILYSILNIKEVKEVKETKQDQITVNSNSLSLCLNENNDFHIKESILKTVNYFKTQTNINKSFEYTLLINTTNTNTSKENTVKSTQIQPIKPIKQLLFSNKKTFAFKFLYIGTNYDGLIIQQDTSNTIEDKLLAAFLKCKLIENIKDSNFSRCGRTDKGVSSFSNCFNIDLRYIKDFDYIGTINKLLPEDIKIISFTEVDLAFDSRFSCLYREYKYFFIKKSLDIEKMKEAALKLKGEHNFFNFCKVDKSKTDNINYIRKIYDIKIIKFDENEIDKPVNSMLNSTENDFYSVYYLQIKGSAFLWHQIRCIMSVLLLIAMKKEEISVIDHLLNEKDYHFNYSIAEDYPLLLSNCEFECVDFKVKENTFKDTLFSVSKLFERKTIEYYMTKYILRRMCDMVDVEGKEECVGKGVSYYLDKIIKENPEMRREAKYTQILKRKRNLT